MAARRRALQRDARRARSRGATQTPARKGPAVNAGSAAARARGRAVGWEQIAVALVALAAVWILLAAAVAGLGGVSLGVGASSSEAPGGGVTALAEREIPPTYLRLYEYAAQSYGLDWAI